jgi:hypothetical protein
MDDLYQFGYITKLKIIIMVIITIPQGRYSSKAFFYWRNFAKNEILNFKNMKMKQFSRVSIAKSEGKISKNCQDFYIWFQVCNHRYRRLIKNS